MGRSGYSDDCDGETPVELYRQAVENAILGRRGQRLLRRLRDALDAMPVKRLIANDFVNPSGEVCALGAVDPSFRPSTKKWDDDDAWEDEYVIAEEAAAHFNIARALAAEIMYLNDEWGQWRTESETPEQRWVRMREWVQKQIGPDDSEEPR